MRFRSSLALPGIFVLAAAIAGCGGGQTNLSAPPVTPTHAPTTAPTTVPTTVPTTKPTTVPTASPSPTASPTPTSSPSTSPITLTPTSVVVAATGSGCTPTATFQATEVGYAGSFSAVSNNTAIATVTPTQAPGQFFTVTGAPTAQGTQGTTITVTDTLGNSATEGVTIAICLP